MASQASEGWVLLKDRYDDGGLSGGTLERPALQRLLTDIAASKVDIVVVYKVDRLTRSLLDFARLVEALDKTGTSFVSITQSFNTTTSMGRLTLNMLLSFAQFEREVTAERIRDKLAASKARGMWMGGTPPLGYEPNGRSLAIVEEHADLVRSIFQLYLDLGTVRAVCDELDRRGIAKPLRLSKAGKEHGGRPFGRGELYALLSNPIYIGRIQHKGVLHQGLHPAIIDPPVWDAVQQQLKDQRTGERHIRSAAHRSLLVGKLVDGDGQPLVASHASKGARRYRYYVSRDLQLGGKDAKANGLRIPAAEIEQLVCARLAERLDDPVALIEQINPGLSLPDSISNIIAICRDTVAVLRGADHPAIAQLIASVVERIEVRPDGITIKLDRNNIAASLNINASAEDAQPIEIAIAVKLKRASFALRLVLPNGNAALPQTDDRLLKVIATAREWWKQLMADPKLRIADLAAANAVTESWVTRVLRLAFLDPAIVQQIISGTAPVALTFDSLRAPDAVPALWSAQRALHQISITR
ncbi:recombinase family protein [Ancylobacter novellus]|uniref:recombinase family protein n=1 Tax=Ancylobacter novellus TaxID=921 RepID=UPI001FCBAFCF